MSSIWTVSPEDDRVDLTYNDGAIEHAFWVRFKKLLSIGEDRRVQTAGWTGMRGVVRGKNATDADIDPEIRIDWSKQTFARAAAYLTEWSLTDDQRRPLPLAVDTIAALHPSVFALIDNALTAHIEAQAQEKKPTAGGDTPSTTSA